ncbi:Periplasmic pH-dependent serine endoprotease DegQ [Nymphon striatum]|nr:Periplasmic pH-dependent serine endoprotease DegQ [Nymphon striatum]
MSPSAPTPNLLSQRDETNFVSSLGKIKALLSMITKSLPYFAGAITLGAYKLFFEDSKFAIVESSDNGTVFNTSYSPTSANGSGINEVDFTVAAENTVNAVVHVKNVTTGRSSSNPWDFFYGSERGNQRAQVGSGSGVIISPDGHIVTNNHVIAKSEKLQVTLNNNKTYDAVVIGSDPNTDIALIKIEAEDNLPYLAFGDSDNTKIGEWVLAVGNPFNLTSTVTAGIVSAKARDLGKNQSFIQTDAAVNPGNSGGALVNTNGDLVGINTAISSQTGSYVGYSFAVPSNIARKVVEDLMEYGTIQKGILGIKAADLKSPDAIEMGINETEGVYVASVEEDTGAADAGLLKGDVIKKVDDINISRFDRQTIRLPQLEFEVKNLNDNDRKKFKTKKGVKIVDVPTRYQGYGLIGKVLLSLDDEEIANINDAKNLFDKITRYGKTSITMINEDGEKERLIFQ